MRPSLFSIACILLFLGTLASGWLHGNMANCWGQAAALKQAGAKLKRALPARLGPWRLVKTHEPQESVVNVLQSAAFLHGVYANDQTGDIVTIALIAGPSGPIAVHSPEICFSARDYEIAGERERITIVDQGGQTHALWQLHANSRHATQSNLRVLFGWSDGTAWQATHGPRFAFAGLPVLYKLQLAGPPRDAASDQGPDPSQDFLARFLADVQPRLIVSSRLTSLSK